MFNVGAYTVSISGVTITGGWASNYGAGIFNGGTLTVTNSTISGNASDFEGGGIYTATSSILNITNSTISGNSAPNGGGGVFNWLGTVTVTNSTITGNTATAGNQAGGIYNHGWLYVTNSTISGNVGGTGAGILIYGTATVTNSTISGNSAYVDGGGIANRADGSPPNSLIITNSTITGNSGGGISIGVTATLSNTIVANQTSGVDCSGSITSAGHNLESGTSCGFTGTGDLQNSNPLLSALASNGGPTQTMALSDSSPAKDAGDNAICAAAPVNGVDQRGYTRPAGATCDIGAFEYGASYTTPDAFTFIDQTGMPLSTVIVSNPVNITGINAASPITITGGDYAISTDSGSTWGSWTNTEGSVSLNNQVKVRLTSSASNSMETTATLTIGTVSDTFSVTTAAASDPNASGLVSWWKAENNAYDSVGGNHGTLQGGATYAAGKINQAFNYDGTAQYVFVSSSSSLNIATGHTVAFWVKFGAYPSSGKNFYIANKWTSSAEDKNVGITSNGNVIYGLFNTGSGLQSTGAMLPDVWNHVVAAYDGSNIKIYINGALDSSNPASGDVADSTGILYIGYNPEREPEGSVVPFNGLIDELKIYNRALSAAEVSKLAGIECANQPVHIDGSSSYHDTIADAYTASSIVQTIKMHSQEFSEILNLNLNKIIKLQGGYDCDYATNVGTYSTINGKLTIGGSSGTVTVGNIKIK